MLGGILGKKIDLNNSFIKISYPLDSKIKNKNL